MFPTKDDTISYALAVALFRAGEIRVLERDLISDALPFGRLWYEQVSDANRKSDDGVTIGPTNPAHEKLLNRE